MIGKLIKIIAKLEVHRNNFGVYSKFIGKPLENSEQERVVIKFLLLKNHIPLCKN